MAHILGMEDVGVTLGARPILGGLNLSLEDGDRIGVVGPNGGGKSTLLRLLTRDLEPDTGRVTMVSGTRFSTLGQADDFSPEQSVREAIHGKAETYQWASDPKIREIHQGLIPDVDLTRHVGELSGGQRRRVALAATLVKPADVVILDEPTNHLDIEGVTYLAGYLKERFGGDGALVVVTHDRWFLDAVCERLWEVVPGHDGPGGRAPMAGHVETYEGGYAAYVLQRAERQRIAQQDADKRANLLRKELAWLRRGAPARTAKPKFRIEAANDLIANEPPPRDTVELARIATQRLGKKVVDLENVSFSWPGSSEPVLRDVTLRLAPGERIGILGANGAGKSSLLGLIAGRLEPTAGAVKTGKTVELAVLSQDTRELDEVAHRRVVESVADIKTHVEIGGKPTSASQLVEQLGFTRERAWTPVAELSGGERRRLQLLRLLMREPNVLLLDEPTNDVDTDTLAAIEDLLDSWPGTLVVVSHDRYLLERTTDHQVAVIDGKLRDLPSGVEQYMELVRVEEQGAAVPGGAVSGAAPEGRSNAAKQREARKAMERAERKMKRVREQIEALGLEQTEAAATVSETEDYARLAELGKQIAELRDTLEELEMDWLEAAELAEQFT
ncbi:ATPase subunit of ABC transporter with duplicated ATPase domains [Trueperella bonasi]|uniref:ATPase subunit of ABC transporter with duplicated ATPase domains n=1 Tax=Trueperella bonasi TaxID=312286 RepID=A0ABT9NFH3_9ACTO|nr:ABC-F family ATP-binding cassette domain-containing protein [Trueperella bonasi]MDP9806139.1 ATPase subunit of ABC transporter with duplicated ATPase domains [Trueperella bonasi]